MPSLSIKDLTDFAHKSFGFLKPVRPSDKLLAFLIFLLFVLVLWGSNPWSVGLFLFGAFGFIFMLGRREVDFLNHGIDKALSRHHDLEVQAATQRENALQRIAKDVAMLIEHSSALESNSVKHDLPPAKKTGVSRERQPKLSKNPGNEDQR